MTDIIKTVGPGGDYADWNALDAALPASLVAANERWIVRQIAAFTTGVLQHINPHTTSASFNLILEPGVGMGFQSNAGKLSTPYHFNAANGVSITNTADSTYPFVIDAPYTEVRGLQFKCTGVVPTANITFRADNCSFHDNILESAMASVSGMVESENQNFTAYNNLLENKSTVGAGTNAASGIKIVGGAGAKIYANDIICTNPATGTGIAVVDGTAATVTGNNVFGFASALTGSAAAGSNNATDKASFGGTTTGNLVNRVLATEFTGASDYRVKVGSALIGAGIAVSGRTTDGLGQALASPPSVGAVEYIVAVADTTPPTMTGTMTASGVSSSGYTLSWAGTTRADNVAIGGYQHSVDGTNWTDSGNVTSRSFTGKAASTLYPNYVRAYDTAIPPNYSTPALLLNVTTSAPSGDTTAPNLAGSITQGAVTATSSAISWPAATDNVAVDHYEVSKDGGSTWVNVAVGTLNYTFTGLTASTTYGQRVRALDAANNVSQVLALAVTTPAASSTGSVPVITGLHSSPFGSGSGAPRSGAFHMQVNNLNTGALINSKAGVTLNAGSTGAPFQLAGLIAGTIYAGVLISDADDADRGYFQFTAV